MKQFVLACFILASIAVDAQIAKDSQPLTFAYSKVTGTTSQYSASRIIPARDYWQQQADTKIDVKLNDKTNFLNGHEDITYTNNSPDTLHYIYIHLWPNAYKNDHTPFAQQ